MPYIKPDTSFFSLHAGETVEMLSFTMPAELTKKIFQQVHKDKQSETFDGVTLNAQVVASESRIKECFLYFSDTQKKGIIDCCEDEEVKELIASEGLLELIENGVKNHYFSTVIIYPVLEIDGYEPLSINKEDEITVTEMQYEDNNHFDAETMHFTKDNYSKSLVEHKFYGLYNGNVLRAEYNFEVGEYETMEISYHEAEDMINEILKSDCMNEIRLNGELLNQSPKQKTQKKNTFRRERYA